MRIALSKPASHSRISGRSPQVLFAANRPTQELADSVIKPARTKDDNGLRCVLPKVLEKMGVGRSIAEKINEKLKDGDKVLLVGKIPNSEGNQYLDSIYVIVQDANQEDANQARMLWRQPLPVQGESKLPTTASRLMERKTVYINKDKDGICYITMPNKFRQEGKQAGKVVPPNIRVPIDPETGEINPESGLIAFESRQWPEQRILPFALFQPGRVAIWNESSRTRGLILETNVWILNGDGATQPGQQADTRWKELTPEEIRQGKFSELPERLRIDAFA